MTLIAPQPLKPRPRQKSIISLETFLGRPSSSNPASPTCHSRQSSLGTTDNVQSQHHCPPSTPPQQRNGKDAAKDWRISNLYSLESFEPEYPVHLSKANDSSVEDLFQRKNRTNFLAGVVNDSPDSTAFAKDGAKDHFDKENEWGDFNTSDYYTVPHSPVARISRNPVILNSSFEG